MRQQMEMNINNSFLVFVKRGLTNLVTQYEKGSLVQLEICMLQMRVAMSCVEPALYQHTMFRTVVVQVENSRQIYHLLACPTT